MRILMEFKHTLGIGIRKLSSVNEIVPWFLFNDHTNYSKWGILFLTDASKLEIWVPIVYNEFINGDIVMKETPYQFNNILDD